PRYLKFCQDYNSQSCCIPGHDLENQLQFENVISGLGPGCKNPMMYPELRYFYCLGCDPRQPLHTNGSVVRVCKKFVDQLWSDPAYDDCGVMHSNACPASWGEENFDPYTCGDDLMLPKSRASWLEVTGQDVQPSGIGFMNIFKPPGFDDFEFIEVDGDDCWNAPAFISSGGQLRQHSGMATALLGLWIGLIWRWR
ncbi:MAG: hypothetical protein SGPRY_014336, partial [Prymnesium sp.]